MTAEFIAQKRDASPRNFREMEAKAKHSRRKNGNRQRARNQPWWLDVYTDEHVLAAVLPLLGIIAVVVLTVVAAGHKNGDAKELLATAVTAVTTLAAASGGHAAGRITGDRGITRTNGAHAGRRAGSSHAAKRPAADHRTKEVR
jgi:hypothetical protein